MTWARGWNVIDSALTSIARIIVWHVRELWVWLSFHSVAYGGGYKVLFLDDSNTMRRGVMFNNPEPDPHELYVHYVARDSLTHRSVETGAFLRKADKHVRWTYGWRRDSAKALLAADALR